MSSRLDLLKFHLVSILSRKEAIQGLGPWLFVHCRAYDNI